MIATPTRTDAGRFAAPPARVTTFDELFAIWSVAAAEANIAFDSWRLHPGTAAYTAFLAAEDRASAAQDALAAFSA
ncbi:MAG: hypothetical protein QOI80_1705 [Solirubrobacteraceae bacterium]|nr:hypothetical protein [Solirubrobacteraceae bacterium]